MEEGGVIGGQVSGFCAEQEQGKEKERTGGHMHSTCMLK